MRPWQTSSRWSEAWIPGALIESRAQPIANIRAEIADGNESWIRNWAEAGGDDRVAADDAWIARHRAALIRSAGGRIGA